MNNELFDMRVGYTTFNNPIAIAPMAGITDSKFASKYGGNAGLVVIGGYNLDTATNEAASKLIARGREEFISDNPMKFLREEIDNTDINGILALNVRSSAIGPLLEAAEIIRDAGAILELDAHCRQPEMIGIGTGEGLMADLPRLEEWIKAIKETGVVLSVKIRANVVDDVQLARCIEAAGADILHIDAMKPGAGADLKAIRHIRDATRIFMIGNNSVNSFSDAKEMFSRGTDMVSISRGVLHDPQLVDTLVKNITDLQRQNGWYNSPKHICRGEGDLRGLTFCCLPVKPCAVHGKIKQLGLTAQEFTDMKMEFAKGTLLEYGDSTCFGSLVWCCKITKPCYLRDGVLDMIELSPSDYMQLKKDLATYILDNAKKPVNEN
ncbi:MAG: methanogenesis marker 9 domain-containing protein [Methanosarcinaceae archaeon]|nr:methanogenesis marker 9 domain-containing protein [Methanosarcinaceae archaeon]